MKFKLFILGITCMLLLSGCYVGVEGPEIGVRYTRPRYHRHYNNNPRISCYYDTYGRRHCVQPY